MRIIPVFFLVAVSLKCAFAQEVSKEIDEDPPLVAAVFGSTTGGMLGIITGVAIGAIFESASGRSCSGSDFCFPVGPIIGGGIGYPIGSSLGLYATHKLSQSGKNYEKTLLWSVVGIGLGGASAYLFHEMPPISLTLYFGLAHIFPAIMMDYF